MLFHYSGLNNCPRLTFRYFFLDAVHCVFSESEYGNLLHHWRAFKGRSGSNLWSLDSEPCFSFLWLFTLSGYSLRWKFAFQSAEEFQTTPKPELFSFNHREMYFLGALNFRRNAKATISLLKHFWTCCLAVLSMIYLTSFYKLRLVVIIRNNCCN